MSTATRPIVEPRLNALIPPLSPEELKWLEESLLADGCMDALKVWKDHGALVDGHHRLSLCERHGIPYEVQELEFENEAAVRNWMRRNALGRRNLKPRDASMLRGQLYLERKRDRVENLKQGKQASEPGSPNRQNDGSGNSTAAGVAAETGVSPRTVERDAVFAQSIETLADRAGVDAFEVLALDQAASKQDLEELLDLGVETLDEMQAALEEKRDERSAARAAPPPPASAERRYFQNTIVRTVTRECPDTGEEIVDYVELNCGHKKFYKRRALADRIRKSANCYECGSGTRTASERRKATRELQRRVVEATRSEDTLEALVAIVRDAMTAVTLRQGDARLAVCIERIGTNIPRAGLAA